MIEFTDEYVGFRPHVSSIMDLKFSYNGVLLATAYEDQTSPVIDLTIQQPICWLSNHSSSVKHVQFQPASNNKVLATYSRDGNANKWGLGCKSLI